MRADKIYRALVVVSRRCDELLGRIQTEERKGEFAVVAHNMICFVEGGSQGHSEGDEEKTDVCSVQCVRQKGPSQPTGGEDGWTDRQTQMEGKTGEQTGGDGKKGRRQLTDTQTWRERKADKRTDTPDNQSSCGLISASQAWLLKMDSSFPVQSTL